MKNSIFSVFVPLSDNKTILYNTFSTSLVCINDDMCNHIMAKNYKAIDNESVEVLSEMGFFVGDDEDEIEKIERIRKMEIEKVEQVVTIFSTNRCNARCYYCFEKGINDEHMSEETAIKTVAFLEKFYPNKELSIKWFGGEPLYNFPSIRIITERLVADGYKLNGHVTTNGSLLTPEMLEFFKSYYSIITFQITIDDIGALYNKIKKYADDDFEDPYRTVVNNCRMVISNNIHVSIRINHLFEKFNNAIGIYKELQKEFEDLDHNYYTIYLANITLPGKKTYVETQDDIDLAIKMQEFNRRHRSPDEINEKYLLYKHDLLPKLKACGATNMYNLTITAQGKIYKCHRLVQYNDYVVGSVEKGIDNEIQHYRFFQEHRIVDTQCRQCSALPICQGTCRALVLLEGCKVDCDIKKMLPTLIRNYYCDLIKNEQ